MKLNQTLPRKKVHSNFQEKSQKRQDLIKMKFLLRKCEKCNTYTLKVICNLCNLETISAHCAKFSPDDKYLKYRLQENYKN